MKILFTKHWNVASLLVSLKGITLYLKLLYYEWNMVRSSKARSM
jgi:hypothetical protein